MTDVAPATTNAGRLAQILSDKAAPAVINTGVYKKDLDLARMAGARSMADLFGHVDPGNVKGIQGQSLNFGSRTSTGMLPEETRLRLWGLKKMLSDLEIITQVNFKSERVTPQQMESMPFYKEVVAPVLKAFDVTDFATWIDRVNLRFFFEEYEIPLLVANLFDQMPMSSSQEKVNGALGRMFGKLETDSATFTGQSNTSASYDIDAKNNVVHATITEDLNQDSAPAVIEKLRKEVLAGIARSEDRTIIDGDVTGTHQDADVTAATDFRKAFNGLRKRALDNSANGVIVDHGGDTPSLALFKGLLNAIGRFAADKGDLAWIMSPSVGNAVVTGAIPELFTAFAFGGPASNRTGQLPPIFGIQPIETEYMREDLHESGVYTIAAQTKTGVLLVKKSRFMKHLRANTRVWASQSLPSSDIMLMTAKKRHTFGGTPQSSTETSVAYAIDVETAS